MRVRELMSYPIFTVRPDATVFEAIEIMAREGKGSLLVAREGLLKNIEGIVTTSGLFLKVFAEGLDPNAVKVSEVMTKAPLITINLNASSKDAAGLMIKHKIRRLPVVEDGTLVGIVTSKDLLRCVQ
jgi:CBS domain-containing protein